MRRYDSYKNSGVEWIGEIPTEWRMTKLKFSDLIIMGQSPKSEECNQEGIGVPFIQGNAEFGELHPTPKLFCEVANKIAKIEDVLFSVRAPIGAVNIANANVGIGRGLCAVRAVESDAKYLYYYSLFMADELISLGTGSTFKAVTVEDVKCIPIPKIPIIQQTQIAKYLDQKTTQIDKLISDKQKLIELLNEERTAMINQAVTKGLDPNVTMKDSGIEWLGKIPEHWDLKKLKFLLKEKRDALKTGPFGSHLKNSDLVLDGEFKVYTQRNVMDNNFQSGDDYINANKYDSLKSFKVETGDILLTTRGTIGRCSIFPKGKAIGILHPCLIRLQVDETKATPNWIVNYINNTSLFFSNIKFNSNSTIIDVIYGYTLKEIFFPIPTLDEQKSALLYIENELNRISIVSENVNKEIELLKEYRTALISEVVTGKIDVRDEVIGGHHVELVSASALQQ